MLIHNKLYTSNTNGCRAKRVEKYINQNTRKDTLLKRQQFVTKNQETSVKTELSPDKFLRTSCIFLPRNNCGTYSARILEKYGTSENALARNREDAYECN